MNLHLDKVSVSIFLSPGPGGNPGTSREECLQCCHSNFIFVTPFFCSEQFTVTVSQWILISHRTASSVDSALSSAASNPFWRSVVPPHTSTPYNNLLSSLKLSPVSPCKSWPLWTLSPRLWAWKLGRSVWVPFSIPSLSHKAETKANHRETIVVPISDINAMSCLRLLWCI